MALFPFGRKLEVSRGYSFTDIPLFSTLSPNQIRLIEKKFRLIEFKRGDLVYEEDTPADAFYVIVSGRFRIFKKERGGEGKTLIQLYRGDYFGESSLLTGQAHSASVEARSDGLLLRLEKEDFLKTLQEVPELSIHLSRTLGHRLTKAEGPDRKKLEVRVAALYSMIPAMESFQFLVDLATSVVRETKSRVLLVDFYPSNAGELPNDFQLPSLRRLELAQTEVSRESDLKPSLVDCAAGFQYLAVRLNGDGNGGGERRLSTFLTFLTYRYDFVLIRLGPETKDPSFAALKQCDFIYLLLDSEGEKLNKATALVRALEHGFGFTPNEIKVIIPSRQEAGAPSYEEKERMLDLKIFRVLPSREEQPERYHATVRFVAKELAGTLLGLVLGSGAAYGLAHIGVLRVLEKENIPVDILAGSSMGALVASFWSAGYRSGDLEKITCDLDPRSAFFKLIGLRDLSLAHRGFFHGRQVTRYMESYLSNVTFQELSVPVKIVATSLSTSQEVVFESGRVVDALRASISIPGIFRPFHYRGELLIDGGILDPLPVDVLTKIGVKKIIAVDVLASPEDRSERGRLRAEKLRLKKEKLQKTLAERLMGFLAQGVQKYFSNNIFNVIMNTIQIMEYEIAQVAGREADVLIRPVVHDAHWAEFYRGSKFIQAGEERTREQLEEIKRLLAE